MKNLIKKYVSFFIPIKLITNNFNPVLLYHSIGSDSKFNENIDHVNLENFYKQLSIIKKYWKFVSIDEYANAKNKKGLASLTIDDGYKNVLDEAIEIFQQLQIPVTLFVNSSTFEGKIFWRDKVRYLIKHKLVKEYLSFSTLFTDDHYDKFYLASKQKKFNSLLVEKDIDNFLKKKNISVNTDFKFCFDQKKYLIKHNLISYGNHTANHYMLSSLNKNEQIDEIIKCKNFIDKQDVNRSNVFSLPFGGDDSYNNDTLKILEDLNYKSILKSRNQLDNIIFSNQIDRFIPKETNIESVIKSLFLKKILKN